MLKNKKGYVQDFLFFGIIIFVFIIIIVMGARLSDDMNTNYQNSSASTEAKAISQGLADRFVTVFDWIFLSVFVLFGLAIIASMFMLDTNPVLFFVVIIIFGFIIIVMAIIGNAYEAFSDNTAVSGYASSLTVSDWLMTHWVFSVMVLGFMGIIALFAKMRMSSFR